MPMMKSQFSQVLASLTGHRIEAPANVPVWIPDGCVKQALSQGFGPATEEAPPEPVVVAPVEIADNVVDDEDAFDVALDQAIIRILTRNDPSDYKADLTPKVAKVIAEMSPDLRRATGTEISDAYARLQESIDLASE